MSKEIGPREKALREMREARQKEANWKLLKPILEAASKNELAIAMKAAAKKRGKPRKAKKK